MGDYTVYIHRNIINNKSYIGITQKTHDERWGNNGNHYRDRQPVFYNAIKKYGWDSFEHIIWASDLSEEDAKRWEVRLIAIFQTNCCRYKNPEYGYNMTDGGDGSTGHTCTDEVKEKMRFLAKNRSAETRAKISIAAKERLKDKNNHPMYGKHMSEEAKKKQSNAAKERFKNPENNPMFGKKHTEEARKRIGEGHKNPSESTRKKMSESAKKRCTDEWREWMSQINKGRANINKGITGINNSCSKHVYQYSDTWELIKMWGSVKSVSQEFKVSISTVSGTWLKNPNRIYHGYHWSLINISESQNDCEASV